MKVFLSVSRVASPKTSWLVLERKFSIATGFPLILHCRGIGVEEFFLVERGENVQKRRNYQDYV